MRGVPRTHTTPTNTPRKKTATKAKTPRPTPPQAHPRQCGVADVVDVQPGKPIGNVLEITRDVGASLPAVIHAAADIEIGVARGRRRGVIRNPQHAFLRRHPGLVALDGERLYPRRREALFGAERRLRRIEDINATHGVLVGGDPDAVAARDDLDHLAEPSGAAEPERMRRVLYIQDQ